MAKDVLKYKGYLGSVEVSVEDKCLHGKLLHVRDVVSYEGATVEELEHSFHEAVDDYLATCAELKRDPQKPFSGTFNVRVGPELHRLAVIRADIDNVSLNDIVRVALEAHIQPSEGHSIKAAEGVVARRFRSVWQTTSQQEFTTLFSHYAESSSQPQEEDDALWMKQLTLPSPQH